jgi:hypothetical protein
MIDPSFDCRLGDDVLVNQTKPERVRDADRYLVPTRAILARDADDVVSHDRQPTVADAR